MPAVDENPQSHESQPNLARLFLLGGFRVEQAGRIVPDAVWGRPKTRAVVKLLALQPGYRLHQEQIMEALWPDAAPQAASKSLRQALYLARHALEPGLSRRAVSAYIRMHDNTVELVPGSVWVDVEAFEERANRAFALDTVAAFDEALDAYTGELLPEDRYEEWTVRRRDQVARTHLELLVRSAAALERESNPADALNRLLLAVQQDPAREDIHRRIMYLYIGMGSRHQALRQYQICRDIVRREFDSEPDEETVALYQEIVDGSTYGAGVPPRQVLSPDPAGAKPALPPAIRRSSAIRLVGRTRPLELLLAGIGNRVNPDGDVSQEAEEMLPDALHTRVRRIALVTGEAGVGKTRLIGEVARDAHAAGALVLWGASYEQETGIPYASFAEALGDYLAAHPPADLADFGSRYPELVHILPSLGPPDFHRKHHDPISQPLNASTAPASQQARLFADVAHLLSDLTVTRPVLLVFDDLHAADAASLELLHYLIHQRMGPHDRRHRWHVLVTYRQEEVAPGSDLQRWLATVGRTDLCLRVDLMRLARPACDELVRSHLTGGTVAPTVLERVHALSLGNPLFVQELVGHMREQGMVVLEGGCWSLARADIGVPPRIQEVVAARIGRLGEDASRVLALASVGGMELSFSELRDAAGEAVEPRPSESRLLDVLDSALATGILEEREHGYAFLHPLVRATLYDHLSRHRRAHYHGTFARAIERRRPDDVAAIAHHYAHSDDVENAIVYLERAGDRASELYAHDAAQADYRALVERLDRQGRAIAAAAAREKLADALARAAHYADALQILDQAATVYRSAEEYTGLARVIARIGTVHAWAATPHDGLAEVLPAIRLLEETNADVMCPGEFALVYLSLACLYFVSGGYDDSYGAAERAVALAERAGSSGIVAEAQVRRATCLWMAGREDEARRTLEDVIPLVRSTGNLLVLCTALINIAASYANAGEFDRSIGCYEEAVEIAERIGDPGKLIFGLAALARVRFLLGSWGPARGHLERALQVVNSTSPSWFDAYAVLGMGQLYLAEGRDADAVRYLDETVTIAERSGDAQALHYAQRLLAEHDLRRGRPQAALSRLSSIVGDEELPRDPDVYVFITRAWALVEVGDVQTAESTIAHAMRQLTENRDQPAMIEALRVRGLIYASLGDSGAAHRELERAIQLASTLPYPYGEARAVYADGLIHSRSGDVRMAAERFAAALGLFRTLGARADIEAIEQVLCAEAASTAR